MSNKDWLMVFLLGLFWGSSFLFNEILLKHISPISIAFVRVAVSAMILIPFIIAKYGINILTQRDIFNLTIMGVINNILPFSLIAVGQQFTTGGLASILNASTSFFTIIVASIFLTNEKLTTTRVLGVLIGVLGVSIAVGFDEIFSNINQGFGKYVVLLGSLSYAFAVVWGKLKLSHLKPMIAATGMLTASSVIMLPIIGYGYMNELIVLEIDIIAIIILFAIIANVLAYFLYFKILESAGAGNLQICTIIIPPAAIILNALILGELITKTEIIGLMIIVIGLVILDGRALRYLKSR